MLIQDIRGTVADTSNNTSGQKEIANDADWVRLQSHDGFSYLVRRKVAQASGTIRNMLDPTGGYAEANSLICDVKERCVLLHHVLLV
jgi:transcription elongation factor B subunit 1